MERKGKVSRGGAAGHSRGGRGGSKNLGAKKLPGVIGAVPNILNSTVKNKKGSKKKSDGVRGGVFNPEKFEKQRLIEHGLNPVSVQKSIIESNIDAYADSHYGPPGLGIPPRSVGDDSVTYQYDAKASSVMGLNISIINAAIGLAGDSSSKINLSFVARFMTDYLTNWWIGIRPNFFFEEMPCVFVDLMHAGEQKNGGYRTAFVSTVSGVVPIPSKSNYGVALGNPIPAVSGSLFVVDSSFSAYTEVLGVSNFKLFINYYGQVLDLVDPRTYRSFGKNEMSMFCSFRAETGTAFSNYGVLEGGTSSSYVGTVKCISNVTCKWLADISPLVQSLNTISPALIVGKTYSQISAPTSIIAHRIIHKRRGYQGHLEEVLLKEISMFSYMCNMDSIIANVGDQGEAFFFMAINGISFNDFKIVIEFLMRRWCKSWMSVATSVVSTVGSDRCQFLDLGSGSSPVESIEVFANFEHCQDNLELLQPYRRSNHFYYPVPIITSDATDGPSGGTYAVDGFIAEAYNWVTGIIAGLNGDVALAYSNYSSLLQTWNKAISQFQSFVTIKYPDKMESINLAALTQICNASSNGIGPMIQYGLTYAELPNERVRAMVARNVVPIARVPNSIIDVDNLGIFQVIYKEYKSILMAPVELTLTMAQALSVDVHVPQEDGLVNGNDAGESTGVESVLETLVDVMSPNPSSQTSKIMKHGKQLGATAMSAAEGAILKRLLGGITKGNVPEILSKLGIG